MPTNICSAGDISHSLEREETSSLVFVQQLLKKIASRNADYNAVREINPAAQTIASILDAERAQGKVRSPLHGIPVLLKDAFPTDDGMATTYGTAALEALTTSFDSAVVESLRQAGAIILGKCSCTDFGDYMSSSMPAEHSTSGGIVKNPRGVRYGRGGGSSTGCAAALAAGFAPIAIGSEAQNSIQGPAANSGLFGFKPTVGALRESTEPSLVNSHTTAGPMGNCVADLALVTSLLMKPSMSFDANSLCKPQLKGDEQTFRIGVVREGILGRSGRSAYDNAFENTISLLDSRVLKFIDNANIDTIGQIMDTPSCVFKTEFRQGIEQLLSTPGVNSAHGSLGDIIRYNERNQASAIPFGQDLILAAEETAHLGLAQYKVDRKRDINLSRELGIDAALRSNDVDALVAPMDFAAKVTGKAGYPVITIPCGETADKKPFALSFIASKFEEKTLIQIGLVVENILSKQKLR